MRELIHVLSLFFTVCYRNRQLDDLVNNLKEELSRFKDAAQ